MAVSKAHGSGFREGNTNPRPTAATNRVATTKDLMRFDEALSIPADDAETS
jgi:hypothetical protein